MLFTYTKMHCFLAMGMVFTLMALSDSQIIDQKFRSSDIELIPPFVVLNSTSTASFFCINHQLDNHPLIIGLSRNISDDQLQLSRHELNETTVHIIIQLNNYIGIFHLFCHSQGKQNQGTRADVIVKAEAGTMHLTQPCQVYNKEYIKCIIRAPTIVRAIQNGFPSEIEFTEISELQSYKEHNEVFKNQSTDEDLVFKWLPTIAGQFPSGVIMNIKVILPYFGTSQYRFDMTPVFMIKPNFHVRNPSKNIIQLELISDSSPILCERSVESETNFTTNRSWVIIDSNRNNIIINDSSSGRTYQVCVRCRQTTNHPYSDEECQKIKSSRRFIDIFLTIILPIVAILCIILALGIFLVIYSKNQQATLSPVDYIPVDTIRNDSNNTGLQVSDVDDSSSTVEDIPPSPSSVNNTGAEGDKYSRLALQDLQ